jgi:hypothetical protein
MRKRSVWICLLALGISSVSVQLVMIREVMSSFGGNELVIGVVLCLAFGSYLLVSGPPWEFHWPKWGRLKGLSFSAIS